MPLKKINLDDFDSRVKKLAYINSSENYVIKFNHLLASFEDDKEFTSMLKDETSILRNMIMDPIFHA